jgi:hypothetical protein
MVEVIREILRNYPSYEWLDQSRSALPEVSEDLIILTIHALHGMEQNKRMTTMADQGD